MFSQNCIPFPLLSIGVEATTYAGCFAIGFFQAQKLSALQISSLTVGLIAATPFAAIALLSIGAYALSACEIIKKSSADFVIGIGAVIITVLFIVTCLTFSLLNLSAIVWIAASSTCLAVLHLYCSSQDETDKKYDHLDTQIAASQHDAVRLEDEDNTEVDSPLKAINERIKEIEKTISSLKDKRRQYLMNNHAADASQVTKEIEQNQEFLDLLKGLREQILESQKLLVETNNT